MKGAFLSWHVRMLGYTTIASGWAKDEDSGFRDILTRYPKAIEITPHEQKTLSGKTETQETICSNYLPDYPGQMWPFCAYCGQERNHHPVRSGTEAGTNAQQYILNPMPNGSRELPLD